jgi:hypothetical protein
MLKRHELRQQGGNSNPITPDDCINPSAFTVVGVYARGNSVIIECKDLPPVELTWKEAIYRARALSEMPFASIDERRRSQQLVEDTIGAAKEARKNEQKNWRPGASTEMFMQRKPPQVIGPYHQGQPINPE